MALPKRDKKYEIKLPVCPYCKAVGKHYGWQCPNNPKNKCKYCGSTQHSSFMCFKKPRKAIRKEAVKTRRKRLTTREKWLTANPADKDGNWPCYLQIAYNCPGTVNISTLTLEHVYSRADYPILRYEIINIKAACEFCNKVKFSNSIENLALLYPRVALMVQTPEWREWNLKVKQRLLERSRLARPPFVQN